MTETTRILRIWIFFIILVSSVTIALFASSILGYLVITRAFTPPQLRYEYHLPLTFQGRSIISELALAPSVENRILTPGQQVDVWVNLRLPSSPPSSGPRGELVQLLADLRGVDGSLLSRSAHPLYLRGRPWSLWNVAAAPLRWTGLMEDTLVEPIKIFSRFQELENPFCSMFNLTLSSRVDPGPDVLGATMHMHLHVGVLRRALYYFRPNSMLALLIGLAALATVMGTGVLALMSAAILLSACFGVAKEAETAKTDNDSDFSSEEDEEEKESTSGLRKRK